MARGLLQSSHMLSGRIVVLGNPPVIETVAFEKLTPEFGWSVEVAEDLNRVRSLGETGNVVAVFFEAQSLGQSWEDALRLVREAAPQALLIPCHRFSDSVNWPELADAGAFHALPVPLKSDEVRQSLSFVWSARLRRGKLVEMPHPDSRRAAMCRCGETPCRCFGMSSTKTTESVA